MFSTFLTLATAAAATAVPATEYQFALAERAPSVDSALSLEIRYGDQSEKAPGLDELAISLPAGMRLDTSAAPTCSATDDEIRAGGLGACPSSSAVGAGTLEATTGVPGVDPLRTDVHVFNGDQQLIEIVTASGTAAVLATDRLRLESGRLVAHPPAPPGGPPDNRTTVRSVAITVDGPDGYITTPPSCPRPGAWSSTVEVRYTDVQEPVSVTSRTPCTPPATMRVRTRPRVVSAGREVRFRVRVTSKVLGCRAGVRVSIAGRDFVTDARGRATVSMRFGRPGLYRLRAAKVGCAPARATLRVTPRG